MRKLDKALPFVLPILMGIAISVFLECVLDFLAYSLSLFGGFGRFPRYIPFCIVSGFLSFLVFVILTVMFFKILKRLHTKPIVTYSILTVTFIEFIVSVIFGFYYVSLFFSFLQKVF